MDSRVKAGSTVQRRRNGLLFTVRHISAFHIELKTVSKVNVGTRWEAHDRFDRHYEFLY